jgi:thiosulfate reductase cytochrome b subunit
MSERIYVFKLFERFWHWSQAGLIMFLMLTAFDIHGTYTIFGFEKAVAYHTIAAWTLIGLWVFAIFWHFTTGEWKQYIPPRKRSWRWQTTTCSAFSGMRRIRSS